jgi:hypothetical protein
MSPEALTFGTLAFDVDPSHDWGNLFCADCGRWPDEAGSTDPCPGPSWRTAAERAARQEAADTSGLRELSNDASPDWVLAERGAAVRVVREGSDRGAQVGNFICEEDAEFAVAAVAYVRTALAAGATERPLDVGCEICGTTEGTSEADRHAWLHP